ncbi:MAG TPA: efflux RND transporter periplasmic adaptor subunit [Opitutaceae bacterium]|nr:efflux RND transporter periplasmic adaptor subunit [Opitutaceae bacterium]
MSLQPPSLDNLRIERSSKPETAKGLRLGLLALLAVVLVAGVTAVVRLTRPTAVAVRVAVARPVTTAAGGRTVLNASGYVTARREATVSSKVTGKVTEVLIEEGMKVAEGQVLARLDDTNVKASLALARAQLTSATAALEEIQVRLKEAEQELQRQTDLRKNQVSPVSDYDHAFAAAAAFRARLAQQQADVKVAENNVGVWQQQFDDTIIHAPFAGIVTSKNAQPGEMISPMSSGGFTRTGICTIVDMDSREVEIDVNEGYINRVEPGQPVECTLDAYPDWKIPCRVIAIIPTADRNKSTVRVRVGFDQLDPRILPDMSVKVAFRGTETATGVAVRRGVLVPKTAVQQRDGHDVVLVVQGGRVERRAVTVGDADATDTLLLAGVTAGERVVVDAPKELTEGATVKEMGP